MVDVLASLWPHLVSAVVLAMMVLAAAHVVLNKRDVRAAIGWVGLILLVPAAGPILYMLLGINRIRRRAAQLFRDARRYAHDTDVRPVTAATLPDFVGPGGAHLGELARVMAGIVPRALLPGNKVLPLFDGDEAYPAMLDAIEGAERCIAFETYIFDSDAAGRRFVDALGRAVARGVDVRVLVDDAGARYSRPPIDTLLRRAGVRTARFMPMLLPWRFAYFNLRNHRKVMVVDGEVAFTGGMNVRHGCVLADNPGYPTRDLHFRVEGPVVTHLMDVFAEDWAFSTREALEEERWFPHLRPAGPTLCRVIVDGPDENLDRLRWSLLGAIACAERSIRILTPYFLPDEALITALNVAALRGVTVDVVLPERGNLRLVEWAMWGELWKMLGRGVRVWLSKPPFDHSKLLVIDSGWALIGSANWDPRSLRLNFELGVECYDAALAQRLDAMVDARINESRRVSGDELAALPLALRLRNGVARLFKPYL
ncbi:MAG: PLDc N-terminal domain-containing protein [Polyangiaceae bacterium]|nr:PLDc N-terminal domain-containing protein [Polyangiaceae bacterium]